MKAKIFTLSILTILSLLPLLRAEAQDIDKVTFYGVDYSKAHAYGVKESVSNFRKALAEINQLFISEQNKYDVAEALNAEKVDYKIEHGVRTAEQLSDNFITDNKEYILTDGDIATIVRDIKLVGDNNYGMVIIAELLDKTSNSASYHTVIFTQPNKEIIKVVKSKTGAKGFGLRNFWARSVLESLKELQP